MAIKKKYHGEDFDGHKLTGLPTPTTAETTAAANVQFVLDNAGGAPLASNVSFTPDADTFPEGTDNVDEALKALFTSANSGKDLIAGAIGEPADSSDTFATLAGYVTTAKGALDTFIDSAEGTTDGNETLAQLTGKLSQVRVFKREVKFLKTIGDTSTITLNEYNGARPTLQDLCLTIFVRSDDETTSEVVADFSNGDELAFESNPYVQFAGNNAQIKNIYSYDFNNTAVANVKEATFNASQFQTLRIDSISSTTLTITAHPVGQLLMPIGNIPLDPVRDISSIFQVSSTSGASSFVKFAISFDSGKRWYSLISSTWTRINATDNVLTPTELNNNGMTSTTVNALTAVQIETLRNLSGNNPSTIKFSYYLQDTSTTQKSSIDLVRLNVNMIGTFKPQGRGIEGSGSGDTVWFSSYNQSTGELVLSYTQSDAYMITYLDRV